MKNAKTIVLTTVIFLLLMSIIFGSGFLLKKANAQGPQRLPDLQTADQNLYMISVSGSGQASVKPDLAVIQIGVSTDDTQAQQALTKNNEQMQALLQALIDGGVQAADIQTQGLQIFPRYSDQTGGLGTTPRLVGYTAMNVVEARVRETDNVGEVLDAAAAAGANTIQGIRFESSDQSAASDQAREAAMQDARHKAEQLATLASVNLGQVVAIQEGVSAPVPFFASGGATVDAAAVPIQPGTQSITVNIQVTWVLVDASDTGGAGTQNSSTAAPATTSTATP